MATRSDDVGDRFLAAYARLDSIMFALDDFHELNAEPLTDFSPEGIEARDEVLRRFEQQAWREAARSEHARTVADSLHSAIVKAHLGGAYGWGRSEVHPIAELMAALMLMPSASAEERALRRERLSEAPRCVDGFTSSLRRGLQMGSIAPRQVVEKCVADIGRYCVEGGALAGLAAEAGESPEAHAIAVVRQSLASLDEFLQEEYLPKTEELMPLGFDAFGELVGAWLGSAVDMPSLKGQLQDNIAHFEAEARRIAVRQGFETTFQYAEFLNSHSTYDQCTQLAETFSSVRARAFEVVSAGEFVRHEFVAVPNELRPIRDAPLNQLFYRWSGDRGTTFVPATPRMRPRWLDAVTMLHEGTPGLHVLHIALHQSHSISTFQRFFGGNRAWSKGWAVYVEQVAGDLGILDQDEQHFAVVALQVWRNSRALAELKVHSKELDLRSALQEHASTAFLPSARILEDGVVLCTSPGASQCYPVGADQWRTAVEAAGKSAQARTALLMRGPVGLARLKEIAHALQRETGIGR